MVKVFELIKKFLIYSQRFTGIDHVYLVRSGSWQTLAKVFSIVAAAASTIFFARLASKDVYGQYQLILAIVSALYIFSVPGINTALMRAVGQGAEGSFFPALRLRIKFSLIGSLLLVFSAGYFYFIKNNLPLAYSSLVASLFFPTYSCFNIIFSYYFAKREFRLPSICQSLISIFSSIAIIFAVYFLKTPPFIIFAYFFATSILYLAIYFIFRRREIINQSIDSTVPAYGFKLTLTSFIPTLADSLERLILTYFLGVKALATYLIAVKITDNIKGFLDANTIYFPKIINMPARVFLSKLKNLWIFIVLGAITISVIAATPFAIRLFFGPKYVDAIFVGQIYSLIVIPIMFKKMIENWLLAQKQPKIYFWLTNTFSLAMIVAIFIGLLLSRTILAFVIAKILVISFFAFLGTLLIKKYFYAVNKQT